MNAKVNPMNDRVARQEAIVTRTISPSRPEAMLKSIIQPKEDCIVTIRYVPDRLILVESYVEKYMDSLPWHELEDAFEVAYVVLDDLNNQLVPKWLQVIVQLGEHSALIEDRQPYWNNPPLLSRQVIY